MIKAMFHRLMILVVTIFLVPFSWGAFLISPFVWLAIGKFQPLNYIFDVHYNVCTNLNKKANATTRTPTKKAIKI